MKILIPVDGSEFTKRTLAYLAAHDELLPGQHEYLVMTAVAPIPKHAARFLDRATIDNYCHSLAEDVLEPVREFARMQHWNIRESVAHHSPADAIAELAKLEKPDLIVMGSHGHSALGNMVLGSVATGVLARCSVPVLLIR